MRRLAVLGASGHGRVVADAAECAGWQTVVFFDDANNPAAAGGPWPIAGHSAALLEQAAQFDGVLVAIGDNHRRLEKLRWLREHSLPLISVIHPAATVSRHAAIGIGSVVLAGAVVSAGAALGIGCIVNTGASVDHDCVLGDGVHVSPGVHLGGAVRAGTCTWIGIGACVRQGIVIGANVVVGAGAAVVSDLPDGITVAGVPARQR